MAVFEVTPVRKEMSRATKRTTGGGRGGGSICIYFQLPEGDRRQAQAGIFLTRAGTVKPMIPVHERDEDRKISLVLSPAATETNLGIVRGMTARGAKAVVVTTDLPYAVLRRLYAEGGVDPARVRIVDAVTKYAAGRGLEDAENVIFVKSPGDLTGLGIAIAQGIRGSGGGRVFVLFDSVSTMLIYLSSEDVSRFIRFVTGRLKVAGAAGVFLAAERGLDPRLRTDLTAVVDEVVETGEG